MTTPCPLRARVAAALVLLYAQPVSRIVRLTVNDVTDDETTVTVQLGDPPSPLPEPVADLMRAYIRSRQHLPYASSRSSQWLFPGRQPGQPMNPVSLQVHLRDIGVPPQRLRNPTPRTPSPGPRHREGTRLSRQDHYPPGHRGRRNLEPIRPRRPLRSVSSPMGPRACQPCSIGSASQPAAEGLSHDNV
jgi:hypothetical protein